MAVCMLAVCMAVCMLAFLCLPLRPVMRTGWGLRRARVFSCAQPSYAMLHAAALCKLPHALFYFSNRMGALTLTVHTKCSKSITTQAADICWPQET
eukprot:4387327-Pleurochrysis_carterae.AAC.1